MYNKTKTGKIYNFDGDTGYIITPEKKYIFTTKNINNLENITIEEGDIVTFNENTVIFGDEITIVAKNINKVILNKNQSQKRG